MTLPAEVQTVVDALKDKPPGGRFNVLFGFVLFAVIGFALFKFKPWR